MKKIISLTLALAMLAANVAFAAPEIRFDVEENVSAAQPEADKTASLNAESPTIGGNAMTSEAKFLMDDESFGHSRLGGVGGNWDVVKTPDSNTLERRQAATLYDASANRASYFSRKFVSLSDGILELQFGASIFSKNQGNGAFLSFNDPDGNEVLKVVIANGTYQVLNADGTYTDTGVAYKHPAVNYELYTTTHFTIRVNLDTKKFALAINGVTIGSDYDLLSENAICEFRYGSTVEGTDLTLTAGYAILTHNYLLLERFVNEPNTVVPDNVVVAPTGSVTKVYNAYNAGNANGGSLRLSANSSISGSFEEAVGNVVFETYILLPTEMNGAKIALTSGENDVFYLTTTGGEFVAPDGTTVKYVTQNLWHIVRFEADTATGKVLVKINGKKVDTYDFSTPATSIDGYRISYDTTDTAATMLVDDLTAFVKTEHADYPTKPVKPAGEDNYLVGINVCSLWREGSHHGWEDMTAYPEITPFLGYYDEGNPEVSDWEIKMMAEHGIDYQIFCWYAPENPDKKGTEDMYAFPIQHTAYNEALIDGYFNARYSDDVKFAIMWENATVRGDDLPQAVFEEYILPYWVEYFFKDDRYITIDNKPLLTVRTPYWKIKGDSANDAPNFNSAMATLANMCKTAGFNGVEVLYYSTDEHKYTADMLNGDGIGGLIGYHWGPQGADADYQKSELTAFSAVPYTVPTISVGFDNVGWGMNLLSEENVPGDRNGMLPAPKFMGLATIVKNALTERGTADTYAKKKMVNISTWNEYGEGTYVMPTLNSDGKVNSDYLEEIRKAFTEDSSDDHAHAPLSDSQRQRINYLFGQDRQLLRPQMNAVASDTTQNNDARFPENKFKIRVSGQELTFVKDPEYTGGSLWVPIFPETGIFSQMMCTYLWNKTEQALTVSNAEHTVTFDMKNKTVSVDGAQATSNSLLATYDGLPVIPLDVLADGLGYVLKYDNDDAPTSASLLFREGDDAILEGRENGKFEFDVDGDLEGWGGSQAILKTANGSLVGTSVGYNAGIVSPALNLSAQESSRIVVRMKWEYANNSEAEKRSATIQYTTNENTYSQSKRYTEVFAAHPYTSKDQFVNFEFDIAGIGENEILTSIRFTPFTEFGTFEIDSIRFESAAEEGHTLSFRPSTDVPVDKMPAAVYRVTENVTLKDYTATASGFEFVGWSDTDGGTVIAEESLTLQADTVLYPVWKPNFAITQSAYSDRSEYLGIRFYSLIDIAAKDAADRYGFIVTRKDLLGQLSPEDFKMDSLDPNKMIDGVAYDQAKGIDIVYATEYQGNHKTPGLENNKNRAVTVIVTGIPNGKEQDNFVVRPYLIVGGKTYYSKPMVQNYYTVADAAGKYENFFDADCLWKE